MTRLALALVLAVALATALGLLAGPAGAAALEPAVVTITAPAVHAGEVTTVTVTVTAQGAPVVGGQVLIERSRDGGWVPVADVVTDDAGRVTASVTLRRDPLNNQVRATVAATDQYDTGSATSEGRLRKFDSSITLRGPDAFVDETTATLTVRWRAVGAGPIGGRVDLVRRLAGEREWRRVAVLSTGNDGVATIEVTPRVDSRWRVFAPALPWVLRARSEVHHLDNRPPVAPVLLPRGAPQPRRSLPPQRRAVGNGPNAKIGPIPGGVWRQMTGRSWHRGCPVGRGGLRLVKINYWDYTGYRRRGELVVATSVSRQIVGALRDMYAAELPIRSMYRVDRFGWSGRLGGADDYASMSAGNTSAFNCRSVVGRPGVRSPHSYGRSLDINPWENPYRSPQGVYPNTWWLGHSHPKVAWRSRGHRVVQIMARHGLRWTYGLSDIHHFDAVPRGGRVLRVRGCDLPVCH